MANDPDNTVIEDWKELHSFIWEDLALPFGDSLFVRTFNANPARSGQSGNQSGDWTSPPSRYHSYLG